MTISTQTRTAGPFTGTGVLVSYPFAFKVFQASDLLVYRTDTSGAQTQLVMSSDYTVSLNVDQNAAPGGLIIPAVALAVGYAINVTSAVPLTQNASLTNAGGFFPKTIEDALDRLTIVMQQQGFVGLGQTMRVPEVGGLPLLAPAAVRANNLLSFDASGNPIAVAPANGSAASLAVNLASSANGGGVDIVAGSSRWVANIATLKTLLKTGVGTAHTLGYYTSGDGGGGTYRLDTADTTSTDNGGTVFVAADGGRWKLVHTGSVYLRQFGCKGDSNGTPGSGTDDSTAFQNALNWASGQTSSTVGTAGAELLLGVGLYRTTKTLYIGCGTNLRGVWSGGYPYITAGATQTSAIVCDFGATVNQWGLDSQTFHSAAGGGGRILYNEWINDHLSATDSTGFNATFGVSISGLILIDANNALQTQIAYGALRLNGCPNARIDNVSVLGFGYSVALGCSFGTTLRNVTSTSNWYGFVGYNANNDISLLGCQFDKIISPTSAAVPVSSIPNWMASSANFVAVYKLDGSHYGSAKGVTIAAAPAIGTNGAIVDVIAQYWPDTCFLNNAYSTTFLSLYAEQCSAFVLTTAYASFNLIGGHNYSTTAPLPYFADFGYNTIGKANVGGNNTCQAFWLNAWASLATADATLVGVANFSGTGGKLPAHQRVTMDYETGAWTPAVTTTSGALTSVTGAVGTYTKARDVVRIEGTFTITTNGTGAGYLQIDGLPYVARNQMVGISFMKDQGAQMVTTAGSTRITVYPLSGAAYLGASGITYFFILTYLA